MVATLYHHLSNDATYLLQKLRADVPADCIMMSRLIALLQVSALEVDIAQVRLDLITKDDQLRELTQQAASEDQAAAAEAAAEVRKLKAEKNSLQAQLECKSRQLKVGIHFLMAISSCADT